jgi:hypothetical protein
MALNLPGGCPVTFALMGACLLTYVTDFLTRSGLWDWTIFFTDKFGARPWTLFTYPLYVSRGTDPISFLLMGFWIWIIGGSLERTWSTRIYALFLLAITILSALFVAIGAAMLLPTGLPLSGPFLPMSAVTVAWGMSNPDAVIYLYMILPVKGKWIAWLDMVMVYYIFGSMHLLLGVFALGGCFAAWWYVRNMRVYAWSRGWRGRPIPDPEPIKKSWRVRWSEINPFERYARWKRKRDFARLMRNSGFLEFEEEEEEEDKRRRS